MMEKHTTQEQKDKYEKRNVDTTKSKLTDHETWILNNDHFEKWHSSIYGGKSELEEYIKAIRYHSIIKAEINSARIDETMDSVAEEEFDIENFKNILQIKEEEKNKTISKNPSTDNLCANNRTEDENLLHCKDMDQKEYYLMNKNNYNLISSSNCCLIFVEKKRGEIIIDEVKWSDDVINNFITNYEIYGKNFSLLSKMLGKDIKEVIKFYYRNKRKYNFKKKIGRNSDEQIKLIIENDWCKNEMILYDKQYRLNQGAINRFAHLFINKDVKMYTRYYKKYFIKSNPTKKIVMKDISILSNWSIDERILFSIYQPYFGKNWERFAEHLKYKTPIEISNFYNFYYKFLNSNERTFESYLCETEKDRLRNVYVKKHNKIKLNTQIYVFNVGILFTPK